MDNLYNEVVMISNKCRDRATYYGRKMRSEENELVAERAAVLEQEYGIIHSDLERAIGNNPPAEDKEKPENSSQAVPKCKTCKHADKSKRESLCQYNYTAGTKGCFALRQYL